MVPRAIARVLSVVLLALAVAPATGAAPPLPTREEREALRKRRAPIAPTWTPEQVAVRALQDDVDVTHYRLDLTFDPGARTIAGTVEVTASSVAPDVEHLVLDLVDGMTVTGVTLGGAALTFTHGGDLLDVTLDRAYGPGESFVVTVAYGGSPTTGTGLGTFGWNKYQFLGQGQMAWSLSEPDGARTWWPCKDRPDDKATVEELWTVPAAWIATGNGVLIDATKVPHKRMRYTWVPTHPLTTYLVSVAATDYVTFSDTYLALDGTPMPVDYYVYPEDLADAQESFNRTPDMIAFFADTFGEYPFVEDKYGMSAFPFSGAMEHSTNTSYGYTLINGGHGYDYIVAHELSHQWWGDSVSPRTWADVWLNEGFATYSEALWREHEAGAQAYRDYMSSLWRQTFSGTVYDPADLFGSTVYDKGAWVQHMLRGVLGDAPFLGGLRDWYAGHRDGVGDTAQYRATMEARHGASLSWFFDEWVYGPGRPSYEHGFTTADLGDGTYRTWVRIRQVQPSPGTFTMPVELTLVTGSGDDVRTVWNDAADQDFALDSSEPPTDVRFDDEDWILKGSVASILLEDADADGVPDRDDDCPQTANPRQEDFDGDGAGDACDPDDDGDLLADAEDCAPLDATQGRPETVATLAAERGAGGSARLTWAAAARADGYDVTRGRLAEIAGGSYGACLATMLPATSYDDPDLPATGEGFGYLARGRDAGCGGPGPLGEDSAGAERASPCP